MRYSLLAAGKRVRPVLTIMTTAHLGGREQVALDPACAIEMVHTASLILDDLPCMDDAALRRGRPANHRVFGEDTALLAAMALLNGAYAVIVNASGVPDALRVRLIDSLTGAIGTSGLIAGQERDLHGNAQGGEDTGVEQIHLEKTAALFVAATETGARLAGLGEHQLEPLRTFGRDLGLAFQIADDLIDVSSSESAAGKDVGKDGYKATFVSSLGSAQARRLADQLIDSAVSALAPLAPASDPLAEMARCLLPQSNAGEGARGQPDS
jgi:geranylgeranyl diphosphate synthase type II